MRGERKKFIAASAREKERKTIISIRSGDHNASGREVIVDRDLKLCLSLSLFLSREEFSTIESFVLKSARESVQLNFTTSEGRQRLISKDK